MIMFLFTITENLEIVSLVFTLLISCCLGLIILVLAFKIDQKNFLIIVFVSSIVDSIRSFFYLLFFEPIILRKWFYVNYINPPILFIGTNFYYFVAASVLLSCLFVIMLVYFTFLDLKNDKENFIWLRKKLHEIGILEKTNCSDLEVPQKKTKNKHD